MVEPAPNHLPRMICAGESPEISSASKVRSSLSLAMARCACTGTTTSAQNRKTRCSAKKLFAPLCASDDGSSTLMFDSTAVETIAAITSARMKELRKVRPRTACRISLTKTGLTRSRERGMELIAGDPP